MSRAPRTLLAAALLLLAAACGGESDPDPVPPPGTSPAKGAAPDRGAVDWSATDPVAFLDLLASRPDAPFSVVPMPPEDWIREEDVARLVPRIRDTTPAAAVVSPLSSYVPFDEVSTVGREAMFLITGFREKRYPPRLCSLRYFDPDPDEIEAWWKAR